MYLKFSKKFKKQFFTHSSKEKHTFLHFKETNVNWKNKLFSEILEISNKTQNFRPYEGCNPIFWQNLNNFDILE